MEILVEPAGLPERGTVIVPVGHDGALSNVAASLDEATHGLVRRALAAAEGGLKHGRAVDLFLPAGLTVDRVLLLPLGKAEGVERLELEEAGGSLAQKLRALKLREAVLRLIRWAQPRPAAKRGRRSPGPGRRTACLSVPQISDRRRQGRGRARARAPAGRGRRCGSRDRGDAIPGGGRVPGAGPGQRAGQRPDAQGVRRCLRRAG